VTLYATDNQFAFNGCENFKLPLDLACLDMRAEVYTQTVVPWCFTDEPKTRAFR